MKRIKEYEYHELSFLLPLLEGEEFESLVEDIKSYGQLEPITLFEGKILDGRNRYRACLELGIEVKVKEWKPSESSGLTPLQYVISENIMRRHLNVPQRAEIGLILLPEVEEQKIVGRPKKLNKDLFNSETYKEKGQATNIVGKKVKVSSVTLGKAKTIKKVAKTHPKIAKEWDKALKGEIGVDNVYKQVKEIEDDKLRLENAKKYRAMEKQKKAMEKLQLRKITIRNKINELENAIKTVNANLTVLTNEAIIKYPALKEGDSDTIITSLDLFYDTLDLKEQDEILKELKREHDALTQPLREQLAKLESDFLEKKSVIDAEKAKINAESVWIEQHTNAMASEYEKIELYEKRIKENNRQLKELEVKYDSEFKKV